MNLFYEKVTQYDLDQVKTLLDSDPSLVEVVEDGFNALGWILRPKIQQVSYGKFMKMVKLLVERKINVNYLNKEKSTLEITTPLSLATQDYVLKGGKPVNFSSKLIEFLIDSGADIHKEDSRGDTPIIMAARMGNIDAAKVLVARGANVNTQNHANFTPLQIAIQRAKYKMVEFLIQSGANVNKIGYGKNSPLFDAVAADFPNQVIQSLLFAGADINFKGFLKGDYSKTYFVIEVAKNGTTKKLLRQWAKDDEI